jgi:hypothetical protein
MADAVESAWTSFSALSVAQTPLDHPDEKDILILYGSGELPCKFLEKISVPLLFGKEQRIRQICPDHPFAFNEAGGVVTVQYPLSGNLNFLLM